MKSGRALIILVILAHLCVALVTQRWGLKVTLCALSSVALASWLIYTYSVSAMDRLYTEYLYFDDEMKDEFMSRATPEIRAEIEKRRSREEKKPNQLPQPTPPSRRG